MWVIKHLNGKDAGKRLPLKAGAHTLGRHPESQIVLTTAGASKSHAQIQILDDKVIVTDLNSRNGTFVNGVRIRTQKLKSRDKLQIHDQQFEILEISEFDLLNQKPVASKLVPIVSHAPTGSYELQPNHHRQIESPHSQSYEQGSAPMQNWNNHSEMHASQNAQSQVLQSNNPLAQIREVIDRYVEQVVLPAVFRLGELFELKWIIYGFVILFALLVTTLSVLPMSKMTTQNIQRESQRRALTVAKNLALINRTFVLEKRELSLTTQIAEQEVGVKEAYIISANRSAIMAPASKAGSYADHPFIVSSIKLKEEHVEQITETQIGAIVPINGFDAQLGMSLPKAYAVVIYNIDESAVDFNRTIGLFVQVLVASAFIGLILHFFLYQIIKRPFVVLNQQVDSFLKDGTAELKSPFQDASIKALVSNMNSALSRTSFGGTGGGIATSDTSVREIEAHSLVDMMGWAALAISAVDERIIHANSAFLQMQSTQTQLDHCDIDDINDPALKESIKDLISQLKATDESQRNHQLPSGGSETFHITAQKINGKQEIAYYIFSIMVQAEEMIA